MAAELLAIKQKIIATDKLIHEYRNSKFECDALSKKNEELTRLVDKLHRDLNARNSECAKLLAEHEPLKKANSKLKQEIEEANKEAARCKAELDASKVYTNQLAEKVKSLEKLEENADQYNTRNKEFSKMENKMETLKDQLKEAKDSLGKARKELRQLQTKHKQLSKYALAFGKAAVNNGKLTVVQKRFYQKLCDGNDGSDEEADVSANPEEESGMESKMLEDMLSSSFETPKSTGGTRKSPRSAQASPVSAVRSSPAKPTSMPSPRGAVSSPRTRGKPRTPKGVVTSSPETRSPVKLEPQMRSVESSDTDATIESDHEVGIRGISRIRTRSITKSTGCTPHGKSASAQLKFEATSLENLLSDVVEDSAQEVPLRTTTPVPPAEKKSIEDDLSLSSSDEDEDFEDVDIPPIVNVPSARENVEEKMPTLNAVVEEAPDKSSSSPSKSPAVTDDIPTTKEMAAKMLSSSSDEDEALEKSCAPHDKSMGNTTDVCTVRENVEAKTASLSSDEDEEPDKSSRSPAKSPASTTNIASSDEKATVEVESSTPSAEPSKEPEEETRGVDVNVSATQSPPKAQSAGSTSSIFDEEPSVDSPCKTRDATESQSTTAGTTSIFDEKPPVESPRKSRETTGFDLTSPASSPVKQKLSQSLEGALAQTEATNEVSNEDDKEAPSSIFDTDTNVPITIVSVSNDSTEGATDEMVNETQSPVLQSTEAVLQIDGQEAISDASQSPEPEPTTIQEEKDGEMPDYTSRIVAVDPIEKTSEGEASLAITETTKDECVNLVIDPTSKEESSLQPSAPAVNASLNSDETTNEKSQAVEASSKESEKEQENNGRTLLEAENRISESVRGLTESETVSSSGQLKEAEAQTISSSPPEEDTSNASKDRQTLNEQMEVDQPQFDTQKIVSNDAQSKVSQTAEETDNFGIENAVSPVQRNKESANEITTNEAASMSVHETEEANVVQTSPTKPSPKANSLGPDEIDQPSSTSETNSSAAVQVPEVHSSPSKLKSKKKNTLRDLSPGVQQPSQPVEPFRPSSSTAFVSVQNDSSAFKVPAIPPLPVHRDPAAVNLLKRPRSVSAEENREVAKILQEARKLLIELPRVLSPLPEPPKPKPEPKHAMIPRCAFNWMGKKLPISTALTEQFGAYVKPGTRIRIRFRRVSRQMRDLRAPDIICHRYHGVANYAEAEKKLKRVIDPNAPLIDDSEVTLNLSSSVPVGHSVQNAQTCELSSSLNSVEQRSTPIPNANDVGRVNILAHGVASTEAPVPIAEILPKSKEHKKKKKEKANHSLNSTKMSSPVDVGVQRRLEIEPPIVQIRPAVRVEHNIFMSTPSVEKRPKLVFQTSEESVENLSFRVEKHAETIQRPLQQVPSIPVRTPNPAYEEVRRDLEIEPPAPMQRPLARVHEPQSTSTPIHKPPQLTSSTPAVEKRPKQMANTFGELNRSIPTEQNLVQNPSHSLTPAPSMHANQRSKEALFGSDSEPETEDIYPHQHTSLPKIVTRPSVTPLVAKQKRPVTIPRLLPAHTASFTDPPTGKPARPVSIAPCSESLISAVSKVKSTPRMVAARRQVKEATTPLSSPASLAPDEDYVPAGEVSRKRIAHAPKRPLEEASTPESPMKKARTPVQAIVTAPFPSTFSPQESALNVSAEQGNHAQISKIQPPNTPTPLKETNQAVGPTLASPVSFPSIRIRQDMHHPGPSKQETSERGTEDESLSRSECSDEDLHTTLEETPASPEPQEVEDMAAESNVAPVEIPDAPLSPDVDFESPQSPPSFDQNLPKAPVPGLRVIPSSPAAREIQTEAPVAQLRVQPPKPPPCQTAEERSVNYAGHLPHFLEVLLNDSSVKAPKISKALKKIRSAVRNSVDKVCQAQELTDEIFDKAIRSLTMGHVMKHSFIVIRHIVLTVIRAHDADLDLSHTPPLPPLPTVHQRCIALLLTLDESNREFEVDLEKHANRYSDNFLSEVSYTMFNPDTILTVDEMCSLARMYVALCRGIGDLGRARSFLYDCMYFKPARAFALAYVVVTVWGEVLRPVSFPTGPSCVDQTIAFLLQFGLKVKAAVGTNNRVTSIRSLLQTVYGYKGSTCTTANILLDSLMNRLKETRNLDEAASLAWCLALVARWEGVAWAVNTIQKVLWPFLERWSNGEGTNAGAAAAIRSIGLLGKWVPVTERKGVDVVFGAMKAIIKSTQATHLIVEAAVETVILLGSESQPNAVLDILKEWEPKEDISEHLQNVLKAFLKKSLSKNPLVNDESDGNSSASD